MRTLFSIGSDLAALDELCNESDAENTPEIEAAIMAWLETLKTEESAKMDNYAGYIRTLEMEEAAAKEESERWAKKSSSRGNQARYMKSVMLEYLKSTGRTKVITDAGRTIAIQNNGGVVPMLISESVKPEQVPSEYTRTRIDFDTAKIRAALESGVELEFASMGVRGQHLRIR